MLLAGHALEGKKKKGSPSIHGNHVRHGSLSKIYK
jgi:hypothetical protein